MPEPEDTKHWLADVVTHLDEATELAHAALRQLHAGEIQQAVDFASQMRLPVSQSNYCLIGFLSEMHQQGVDPAA